MALQMQQYHLPNRQSTQSQYSHQLLQRGSQYTAEVCIQHRGQNAISTDPGDHPSR